MALSLTDLRTLADQGEVDTVIVAITDMQGRLQGKRCSARYFLDEVVPHAAEACNYLLAVDELELPPECTGNAYESACPRVPTSLQEAALLLQESKVALAAFGQVVVDHYLNAARVELEAYRRAVTDWERFRGFERL